MSAGKGFWEGAHCMWCGAVEGTAHTAGCKREVGITDGPSKSAIDAHRAGFAQNQMSDASRPGSAFARDVQRLEKLAAFVDERGICSRCGDGFPFCADFEVLPRETMHKLACDKYTWGDLCSRCERELESEDPDLPTKGHRQ